MLKESNGRLPNSVQKSVEPVEESNKSVTQNLVAMIAADLNSVNDRANNNLKIGAAHNVPSDNYVPAVYEAKKLTGLSTHSGVPRLLKLRPLHKKILALHLSGVSNIQISKEVNRHVCWISDIIRDPLCKSVLDKVDLLHTEEFKRLRMLANEVLRSAMQPGKTDSIRLSAAKTYYQREGQIEDNDTATAEDVMGQVLAKIEANNVQINIIGGQR